MKNVAYIKAGVPFPVKLRTYLLHLIIAVIALVVNILIFEFLMAGATFACAEIKRINDAPHNEIIFSGEINGEDSFYYLKQHHLVGSKNTNVSCDIFMVSPDTQYANNDIYFSGTLEKGTCAVSNNLAGKYGVNIGDTVKIVGIDKTLKVARLITAQSGIDKEYLHDGIAVIAYDEDLLSKQYSYVSFTTDGDEYHSLISLVFINDWINENVSTICIYSAIFLAALCGTMVVCELFLFTSRRKDYSVLVLIGCKAKSLFIKIWLENSLKYLVPVIIAVVSFLPQLICYGFMYALPAVFCLGSAAVIITLYSLIKIWRLYK